MAQFELSTLWIARAPLQEVWDALYRSDQWPEWWRGVEKVTDVAQVELDGHGAVRRYTWKGLLPYRLTFDVRPTRLEPMHLIEGEVSGDLYGIGRWLLDLSGDAVHIRHEWYVDAAPRWMHLLPALTKPVFEWNHHLLMRRGAQGLARRLDASVDCRPRTADPGRARDTTPGG